VFASLYSGGRTRAAIKQTTGIQNLDLDALLATRVRCPELPEQRAVADYLDRETARIDALIEKKHSAAELLLERWLAALCSRLLGRKRHEPFSRVEQSAAGELTLIPLKRLLEHVWSGDWGGEPGSNDIDLTCIRAADFDFALLEASGGVDRSFAATSVRGRALLPGDLVIEKSGGGDGVPVGRVVVWRGPGLAMPTNFAGAMRPDPRFDPDFVLLVFRAAYEIGLPWRSIKQTTGLQNLDMTHYLSQHWPVPDVPEQRRVASELMEELRSCRKAQELFHRQIDLLREHRQALITAAVTGGLEVPGVAA
jgi:type I restriction enzyme S subunit